MNDAPINEDGETLPGEAPIVGGEYFFRARLDPVQAYQIEGSGDVQTEVRALFGTGDETRDFDDTVTSVRLHTAAGILIAFPGNWIVQLGSRVHVMDDKDFRAMFVSDDELLEEQAAAEVANRKEIERLEAEKLEQDRAEQEQRDRDAAAAEAQGPDLGVHAGDLPMAKYWEAEAVEKAEGDIQTDHPATSEGDTGADKPA